MTQQDFSSLYIDDLIHRKQLVFLRALALIGQFVTVLVVYFGLGFDLPLLAVLGVIGVATAVNLGHIFYSRNRARMTNHEVFLLLGFDTLQLFALLFLTGGLSNPFSVLLLAPVTVSASLLSLRYTFSLIALVAVLVSILAGYHLPLPWNSDGGLDLSMLYLTGLWVALVLAVAFIGIYTGLLTNHARQIVRGFAEARFHMAQEQRGISLGSLATVAAHKLGSPLNTITLIVYELEEMLHEAASHDRLAIEVTALKRETERCRQILAGLAEDAHDIDQMHHDPIAVLALVQGLIDDRFQDIRRDMISISARGARELPAPLLMRRPDIIYSLEMVIDNAVQFAAAHVYIDISWDATTLTITISDDGPGFKTSILSRLGEPYNSSRQGVNGHTGLGLFITSTMIEGVGGKIEVANREQGGGMVRFILPRHLVDVALVESNARVA